ncbi:5-methyltetrahydropteroyltriglutamate--homocysteine S-methyltransferase [Microbacterium amylolyticum]|uniref:5-methyltetrahydropteroyltriglutamate--homocysteine methyltransferase n=1 Tax=Microbacterium amylolyticum TaxID=936337 RepID=A0ABS4ZH15_9MICO|nr:5-methyltetrahydropteroyltriglutamate--homocysteine S-methyltransferase [Microbacterium amylolyticum]MBP2436567.1 5-methyltetrahydropteroyltriglutamate--homocysteine methyltransferase [Microbacterium amylolyticum]
MSVNPPFRADLVGSFLRPESIKQARARLSADTAGDEALRAVEDTEIAALVASQAEAGLAVATDGEFRRAWWHFDFFGGLEGVDIVDTDHGLPFQGAQTKQRAVQVNGRIAFGNHPMLAHWRALKPVAEAAGVTPKQTIPAPTVLDFRVEPDNIVAAEYETRDDYVDDLVQAYRDAIAAFYAEGCRYLQFDDTAWAYLCSDSELERARSERGIETDGLGERYRDMLNRVLDGKPDDLVVTTHICRGNFRSTWISSGGYEPIAEHLFATNYDGFFLEYDSDRAGGFEPLRYLRPGAQTVVLGLVTTKSGELEAKEEIADRIREAAEFAPIEQLALSPQCGFASTEEGNVLTEDEQWAKVRLVREIADEVWASY